MAAVRFQRAAAAKVVVCACDEVHRAAAARVKVGVKRIAVRVDGHQHPLTVGVALKNQLLRLDQHSALLPVWAWASAAIQTVRSFSSGFSTAGRSVGSPLRLSPSMPHSLP